MVNISISVDSKHPTVSETVSSSLPCLVVRIYLNHLKHIQYKSSSKSKKVILVSSQKKTNHISHITLKAKEYSLKMEQWTMFMITSITNVFLSSRNRKVLALCQSSELLPYVVLFLNPSNVHLLGNPFGRLSWKETQESPTRKDSHSPQQLLFLDLPEMLEKKEQLFP